MQIRYRSGVVATFPVVRSGMFERNDGRWVWRLLRYNQSPPDGTSLGDRYVAGRSQRYYALPFPSIRGVAHSSALYRCGWARMSHSGHEEIIRITLVGRLVVPVALVGHPHNVGNCVVVHVGVVARVSIQLQQSLANVPQNLFVLPLKLFLFPKCFLNFQPLNGFLETWLRSTAAVHLKMSQSFVLQPCLRR